jgi:hypothetical protein
MASTEDMLRFYRETTNVLQSVLSPECTEIIESAQRGYRAFLKTIIDGAFPEEGIPPGYTPQRIAELHKDAAFDWKDAEKFGLFLGRHYPTTRTPSRSGGTSCT